MGLAQLHQQLKKVGKMHWDLPTILPVQKHKLISQHGEAWKESIF